MYSYLAIDQNEKIECIMKVSLRNNDILIIVNRVGNCLMFLQG